MKNQAGGQLEHHKISVGIKQMRSDMTKILEHPCFVQRDVQQPTWHFAPTKTLEGHAMLIVDVIIKEISKWVGYDPDGVVLFQYQFLTGVVLVIQRSEVAITRIR